MINKTKYIMQIVAISLVRKFYLVTITLSATLDDYSSFSINVLVKMISTLTCISCDINKENFYL